MDVGRILLQERNQTLWQPFSRHKIPVGDDQDKPHHVDQCPPQMRSIFRHDQVDGIGSDDGWPEESNQTLNSLVHGGRRCANIPEEHECTQCRIFAIWPHQRSVVDVNQRILDMK